MLTRHHAGPPDQILRCIMRSARGPASLLPGPAASAAHNPALLIRRLWGLHLSGASDKQPRHPVVEAVSRAKILWPLRLNGDPKGGLCSAEHKPPSGVPSSVGANPFPGSNTPAFSQSAIIPLAGKPPIAWSR